MSQRERTQIAIGGINTSAPDITLQDGAAEDILNMRYRNGALHNVCEPKVIHPITTSNGFAIALTMEGLDHNEYIATKRVGTASEPYTAVYLVEIVGGVVSLKQTITTVSGVESGCKLSSFGRVLYVTIGEREEMEETSFVYKDGVFTEFSLVGIEPPEFEVTVSTVNAENFPGGQGMGSSGYGCTVVTVDGGGNQTFSYNEQTNALNEAGYVVGGFFVMMAYKMSDGNIVKPSAPRFVDSNNYETSKEWPLTRKYGGVGVGGYTYYDWIYGFKTDVKLKTALPNTDMIVGVVLFITRVNPLWDYELLHLKFSEDGEIDIRGDTLQAMYRSRIINEAATDVNQPFYEIAELREADETITLNAKEHFNDAIFNDVMKPSYTIHNYASRGRLEYNSRMHSFAVKSELFCGYNYNNKYDDRLDNSPANGYLIAYTTLAIDNEKVEVKKVSPIYVGTTGALIPNLYVYPDTRATKVKLIVTNINGDELVQLTRKLSPAYANNLSYVKLEESELYNIVKEKYEVTFNSVNVGRTWSLEDESAVAWQGNKLHVSAMNNPFYTAAENIYTVGETGSVIVAINTATEQITETKFGVHPLYVFTDRSTHAMELGEGEVLYRSIVGVSNESIIDGTTTVGGANVVFYIGDEGVMALSGRYATCISRELQSYVQRVGVVVEFETYMLGATLLYSAKERELIVFNGNYEYGYIYSIEAKMWSRREWGGVEIGGGEIYCSDGVCSAVDEDESRPLSEVSITLRALKLGSMESTRVETVVGRLVAGPLTRYTIALEGTNNIDKGWQRLAATISRPSIRRTPASMIYHRIKLMASVGDYLRITHFDMEYYNRFARRLK